MKQLKEAFNAIEQHNNQVSGLKLMYCFSRDLWLRMTVNVGVSHARLYKNAISFSWLNQPGNKQTIARGYENERIHLVHTDTQPSHPVDTFSVEVLRNFGHEICTFYVYGTAPDAERWRVYVLHINVKNCSITSHTLPLLVGEPLNGTLLYNQPWDRR